MTTPQTPQTLFEKASYELNRFRERRMVERRATPRDTPDRRVSATSQGVGQRSPSEPAQPQDPA